MPLSPTDAVNYNPVSKSVTINVQKADPVVTWKAPTVQSGTILSSTQLNAVASVPGAFRYTPAAGSVKYTNYGSNNLHVDFTPTDTVNYNTVSKDVVLTVLAMDMSKQTAPVVNTTAKKGYMFDPHPVDIENKHPIHL